MARPIAQKSVPPRDAQGIPDDILTGDSLGGSICSDL
jgi:hypothetical protein